MHRISPLPGSHLLLRPPPHQLPRSFSPCSQRTPQLSPSIPQKCGTEVMFAGLTLVSLMFHCCSFPRISCLGPGAVWDPAAILSTGSLQESEHPRRPIASRLVKRACGLWAPPDITGDSRRITIKTWKRTSHVHRAGSARGCLAGTEALLSPAGFSATGFVLKQLSFAPLGQVPA